MWKGSVFLSPGVFRVARVMEAVGAVTGSVRGHFLALAQLKGALGHETAGREPPYFISLAADSGNWL